MGIWTPGTEATAGDDVFAGDATNETADGLAGNDILDGGAGDDTLAGGEGADVLTGGDGDDTLAGLSGADALHGGAGVDAADYRDSAAGVTVSLTLHTGGGGHASGDWLTGIENLVGSAFNDRLLGDAGANVLTGGSGDDVLAGLAGADVLDGGAGLDTVDYALSTAGVTVDFDAQTAVGGHATGDALSGVERAIGSSFNDVLAGDAGANVLNGGAGDDVLAGRAGADSIDGGAGFDTADYSSSSAGVTVNIGDFWLGPTTGGGDAEGDILSGIERLVGSNFNDVLEGGYETNVLVGGAGDDTLNTGFGDSDVVETLDGGAGFDIASYADGHGVTVSLALQGVAQDTGSSSTGLDILIGIEGLEGSGFDDVLTGSSADDMLSGAGWDDVLNGGGGADRLYGGVGDDRFVQGIESGVDQISGDAGFDTLDYSTATAGVNVQLLGWSTTSGGTLLATLSGVEGVIGSAFNDALIGDAANNRLDGGQGADWLTGGAGDDVFVQAIEASVDRLFGGAPGADAGFDTIDYGGASAAVTVQLSGYATSGGVTLATFSGIEGAAGSAFDDALIGNAAANRFNGGAGSDWIVGQGGDDWFVQGFSGGVDRLFGDAGVDTIDYTITDFGVFIDGVVVHLAGGYAALNGGGPLLASFASIEDVIGTFYNDVLIGSGADNRITGGQGGDWLVGGDGDDTFVQGMDFGSIDRLFGGAPGADSGNDTIDYSSISEGVVVQLSGYAALNRTDGGWTLANFSGIENAVGSSFADALIGNTGDNRITGGVGGDWLVGGGGADTFVYRTISDGAGDSIRDFSQTESDLIDLSAIDADPTTQTDDMFTFSTTRTAGAVGEAVAVDFGAYSLVSLYLDGDNVADMTIQIVHAQGVVMNAGDFVL